MLCVYVHKPTMFSTFCIFQRKNYEIVYDKNKISIINEKIPPKNHYKTISSNKEYQKQLGENIINYKK